MNNSKLLNEWLTENFMSNAKLARKMTETTGEKISSSNIRAWRIGFCAPSLHRRPYLEKATKGVVKAKGWQ